MTEPGQVAVACEALHADARVWAEAGTAMTTAADTARGLALGAAQFGMTAEGRGLVAAYTQVQQRLAGLVAGAGSEFGNVSRALAQSADTYQREDAEHARRLSGMGGG